MILQKFMALEAVSAIVAVMLAQLTPSGDWLQALRELGSFGLVAFIVYWYATHVAPKSEAAFLASLKQQREDHIAAQKDARDAYTGARNQDRVQIDRLVEVVGQLAAVTQAHVEEARVVWRERHERHKKEGE